jgi:hypothetical protein
MKRNKIIVILRGGLGNQLFNYAFAKALATKNGFELVVNYKSGFENDFIYKRNYLLQYFNHSARLASNQEMLIPFHRIRRLILVKINQWFPGIMTNFIFQQNVNFDPDILDKKLNRNTIVDGCWISEEYFKEINSTIRKEFIPTFELPANILHLYNAIKINNSVAIHIRWFNKPNEMQSHNISASYYKNAIEEINKKVENPHFYLFTDEPTLIERKINLSGLPYTLIKNHQLVNNEMIDFILMKSCKHFVIANSTFSWWAAWLSDHENKIVLSPDIKMTGLTTWGEEKQVPDSWIKLKV